jgi:hypothetical protein
MKTTTLEDAFVLFASASFRQTARDYVPGWMEQLQVSWSFGMRSTSGVGFADQGQHDEIVVRLFWLDCRLKDRGLCTASVIFARPNWQVGAEGLIKAAVLRIAEDAGLASSALTPPLYRDGITFATPTG